jgi:selenide, water dikinase
MRSVEFPVVKDIVLVGGGHAHVSVLRNFGMYPINGVRLTLISPEADTPYSGMLPGLIASHYTFDETHIDLAPLAGFANTRFFETSVERLDPDANLIYCADGRPPVPYDILSINTGSTPAFDKGLQLDRDVIPVKPVSKFLAQWDQLKAKVLNDPSRRIGIVGAGAGGVELLLSIQYALAKEAGVEPGRGPGSFHVFTRDSDVLKTHGAMVREAMRSALNARGVSIHTGFDVCKVDTAGVSDGDQTVEIDDIIWVTGAEPPQWFANSNLNVDDRGFIAVDSMLRSTSHTDVFGVGDAVAMINDPRPKSGVFAVRQGPVLARNLRARVLGQPLKRYTPQKVFMSLISTGDKYAIASYAGWSLKGEWVWRWKDQIDRAFMTKFNVLPRMDEHPKTTAPTVADIPVEVAESQKPDAMRCGGCGAKVGSATLRQALAEINIGEAAKSVSIGRIVLGVGDDAAAIEVPTGKLLVQTVDNFPAMLDDPYVFGQITANHCLGDIYAMGSTPHSALAVVALPFAPDAKRAADLVQLLSGAQKVLSAAGCVIVGGHTGEAEQLTFGFSINGFASPDSLALKGRLTPGLEIILTKPIGTGALFAAHGRRKAKGRWLQQTIKHATQSNAAAAEILRTHGADAMTDITGFGLAGHLGEMLEASGLAAEIRLDDVPLLPGAKTVVGKGIVSSLQRNNLAWRDQIEASSNVSQSPEFQLLFDPQTAGGLLAGVPADRAPDAIAALRQAGYTEAGSIGRTSEFSIASNRIKLI